jgi:hypothetical protein
MGLWPTQADENQLRFSNYSPGSTALPLVIPTGAQRSGEICGSTILSWKCFLKRTPGKILPHLITTTGPNPLRDP